MGHESAQTISGSETRDLLCRILRCEAPLSWGPGDGERLFAASLEHAVHVLVADRLWQLGLLHDGGAALRERLVTALHRQVLAEEIARPELQHVLNALAAAGAGGVLMKGAALAYTHYPSPILRPRVDADILIAAASRPAAAAALERLGYERVPVTSGALVTHQAPYGRTDSAGAHHAVDLHWEASNPRVFTRALPASGLLAAAVPVPALGDAARALSPIHALAVACVHRVAHHAHRDRLIWLYDIHLIAEAFSEADADRFASFAADRQLVAVCVHGLSAAHRCFGGAVAGRLLTLMDRPGAPREPSAVFAAGRPTRMTVLRSDLAALDRWSDRFALLREHLFPARAYMQRRGGLSSGALLPLSYAWRILHGGISWMSGAPASEEKEE